MLEAMLSHLNNWFAAPGGRHRGTFHIVCGVPDVDFLKEGQYFRIRGSVYNDGLHIYPVAATDDKATDSTDAFGGKDEVFTGEIWALAVPPSVVALAEEIAAWRKSNPETDRVSESFGGYSYSRGDAPGGAVGGWQAAFASRLNPYRRAYDD